MAFDQDPADEYENYQCDVCGGEIRLNGDKSLWECNRCDFQCRNNKNHSQTRDKEEQTWLTQTNTGEAQELSIRIVV